MAGAKCPGAHLEMNLVNMYPGPRNRAQCVTSKPNQIGLKRIMISENWGQTE